METKKLGFQADIKISSLLEYVWIMRGKKVKGKIDEGMKENRK